MGAKTKFETYFKKVSSIIRRIQLCHINDNLEKLPEGTSNYNSVLRDAVLMYFKMSKSEKLDHPEQAEKKRKT